MSNNIQQCAPKESKLIKESAPFFYAINNVRKGERNGTEHREIQRSIEG